MTSEKNKVLEIIDYWKIIEFLGQTDIPIEKADNREIMKKE